MKISVSARALVLLVVAAVSGVSLGMLTLPISQASNSALALMVILLSAAVFVRAFRISPYCSLPFLIMLYVNLSVALGEYFGLLQAGFVQLRTDYYFGLAIRMLLVFSVALMLGAQTWGQKAPYWKPAHNSIIYWAAVAILMWVLATGVYRGGAEGYIVRITPLYEYSYIIFLFALYFMGPSKFRLYAVLAIGGLFVLQDAFFGGRVASLQIIMVLVGVNLRHRLTAVRIAQLMALAMLWSVAVGVWRSGRQFDLGILLDSLVGHALLSDTAVYSYYASVTHVAAAHNVELSMRIGSFLAFIASIVFGSGDELANVTLFVSRYHFANAGGGMFFSHWYFWGGWASVFASGLALAWLFGRLVRSQRPLGKLLLVAVISSAPRWCLYNPLALIRGALFLPLVLYLLCIVFERVAQRRNMPLVDLSARRADDTGV